MKQKAGVKQVRQRYSDEFKEQALRRAEQEGVARVAKDLKLPASQLYSWRAKAQQRSQTSEEQRLQQAENARLKRDVARLEEEVAFLKKGGSVLREGAQVKYATIRAHEGNHSVRMMCRILSVSPAGYYAWRERPPSARALKQAQLDSLVREAYDAEKGRVGSPRVTQRLRRQGHRAGRHQVAKSMRHQALRAKGARKYKATTNSNHSLPVAPNLLQQNFHADRPNQAWVSDITYIATDEGWLYLAVVLDLYSRHVIGWSMSERMTAALVCDALSMAVFARHRPRGAIVHSDRGSQYCSHEYQRLLNEHGLLCSMSKKGDCYDNAAMESWNHSLKVEAIHGERFATRAQAKAHVFEYIEVYYNRQRLHSTLGYLSPVEFELRHVA